MVKIMYSVYNNKTMFLYLLCFRYRACKLIPILNDSG